MKIRKIEDTPTGRKESTFELPAVAMRYVTTKVNEGNGKTYMCLTDDNIARQLAQVVVPIAGLRQIDATKWSWEVVAE